jgi:hypothetical protein
VDLLVMAPLERASANLDVDYERIIYLLVSELGEAGVDVRKAALAPLYGRLDRAVPLVYGEGDDSAELAGFADAITFYSRDDGADYLQDEAAAEGDNLAILGADLDARAIYHPTTADPDGRAYFTEPADGFVVLYLSSLARRCDIADSSCAIDGVDPVTYFSREADGVATWLALPGGGLPAARIFHAAMVTAENTDYETFYGRCAGYPNFPAADLDVMEPSAVPYYRELVAGLADRGGRGAFIDLCEAMSSREESVARRLAADIRDMVD